MTQTLLAASLSRVPDSFSNLNWLCTQAINSSQDINMDIKTVTRVILTTNHSDFVPGKNSVKQQRIWFHMINTLYPLLHRVNSQIVYPSPPKKKIQAVILCCSFCSEYINFFLRLTASKINKNHSTFWEILMIEKQSIQLQMANKKLGELQTLYPGPSQCSAATCWVVSDSLNR